MKSVSVILFAVLVNFISVFYTADLIDTTPEYVYKKHSDWNWDGLGEALVGMGVGLALPVVVLVIIIVFLGFKKAADYKILLMIQMMLALLSIVFGVLLIV